MTAYDRRAPGETYGFYGRLRQEFPSQIICDITEVCNLACSHCPHPAFAKSEHYSARMLDPELNVKLVNETREHGRDHTQYIRYTSNGEPTLHPKYVEMLDYAVKHSGTTVTLTTNGKNLTESRAEKLLATGVHVVDISLDAHRPESYARIRVKGNLAVTRDNVLTLIRLAHQQSTPAKIVLSFVEQAENASEAAEFERYWRDAGADFVVVRRLHSCSGAKADLADERRRQSPPRRACLYPWERIVLTARGDLAFCPSDWVHGSVVADYRTTTISETWNGPFYRALRDAHVSNNYHDHSFCGQCPDWQSTRWPEEGRSYADMIADFKDAR